MKIKNSYNHTMAACCIGYITQAIINNFVPLLFLTFQKQFDIPLSKITILITVNFVIQLAVDLLSAAFAQRIDYRKAIVAAHICSALGLAGLAILPQLLPEPYIGIVISVVIYAIGGGLLEVLVTPIVEACPFKGKSAMVSLLHSFYCWGVVIVIVISTLFFFLFGRDNWRILALIWALIPLLNSFYLLNVPILQLESDNKETNTGKKRNLFTSGIFWLFCLLMIMSGASELSISQWASAFAESALLTSSVDPGKAKIIGDLLGPCIFAITMGLARVLFAKFSGKVNHHITAAICAIGCIICYLIAGLSKTPILALAGCGMCGLCVGIMWPCTFDLATIHCPGAGTAMFAILALAGDLGCSLGPTFVGFTSEKFGGGNLGTGIIFAVVFPAVLSVGYILCYFITKRNGKTVSYHKDSI